MAIRKAISASSAHAIGKQTISVSAADPRQLPQLQAKVARLNSSSLHAVIEDVFNEFDCEGQLISLPNISVDLGSFPQVGFETSIETKLRVALRRELSRELDRELGREAGRELSGQSASPHVTGDSPRSGQGDNDNTFRTIEGFLTRHSAHARTNDSRSHQLFALLQRAMESDPERTAQLLRRVARNPEAVARLTSQLQQVQIEHLIRSLDPLNAATMILLAGKVVESYHASPLDKNGLGAIDKPVWHLVLSYLLSERGTEFNRRQYVMSLVEKLAADTGLGLGEIIEILAVGLELLDRRRRVRTSLASVLRKVIMPARAKPLPSASLAEAEPRPPMGSDAGNSGQDLSDDLRSALGQVSGAIGNDLTKLLARHVGQAPSGRTEIGRDFSFPQLARLARHLSQEPLSAASRLVLQRLPEALIEAMLGALKTEEQSALLRAAIRAALPTEGSRTDVAPKTGAIASHLPRSKAGTSHQQDRNWSAPKDEIATVLLDYLQTGQLSIANRQKFQISSDVALNRAIRDLAASHKEHLAEAVRGASRDPKTAGVWITALEPETLAQLADCALPGRSQTLLAGAQTLAQAARRAKIASDRIGRLTAEFWQFQFGHIENFPDWNPDKDALVEEFLASLAAESQTYAGGREHDLAAALAKDGRAQTESSVSASDDHETRFEQLLDTLFRSDAAALQAFEHLDPKVRRALFGKALTANARGRRAIQKLGDRQFAGLLSISLGGKARKLILAAQELLRAASTLGLAANPAESRFLLRAFLLEFCEKQPVGSFDLTRLLSDFAANMLPRLAARTHTKQARAKRVSLRLQTHWLHAVLRLARQRNHLPLAHSVSRLLAARQIQRNVNRRVSARSVEALGKDAGGASKQKRASKRSAAAQSPIEELLEAAQETSPGASYKVDNAGLVLAAPFLPHLFAQQDLLVDGKVRTKDWRDRAAYARAVHLTQYLITGSPDVAHAQLALNKVVCGGEPDDLMFESFKPEPTEVELCEGLLNAMLANWPPLSSGTTLDGLRQSFLQRPGRLTRGDDGWTLAVERKTLDVLLDQTGWGFRTMILPWQAHAIQVTW